MKRNKRQKAVAMVVTGMVVASNISTIYADTKTEITKDDVKVKNVLASDIKKNKDTDILKGGIKDIFTQGGRAYGESGAYDYFDNGLLLSGVYAGSSASKTLDKDRKHTASRIEKVYGNGVYSCSSIASNGDILYGFSDEHTIIRAMSESRFVQKKLDLASEKFKGEYYKGEDGIRNIKELKNGNIVVVTFSSISILDKKLNKLNEVAFSDLGFNDLNKERVHSGSDIVIDDEGIILPFWTGILKLDFNLEQIWYESMDVGTLSYREGSKNFFVTSGDTIKAYDFNCKLQNEIKIPVIDNRPSVGQLKIDLIESIQQIDENLVISGVIDFEKSIVNLNLVDVKNGKIIDTLKQDLNGIKNYVSSRNHAQSDVFDIKLLQDGSVIVSANNTFLELVNKLNIKNLKNEKPSIALKDKYKDKIEIEKGKDDTNFLDFVTATDNEDGDISKNIKVDKSKLDVNKEGEYTITYSVKDSEGATATLDAKVKIIRVNKQIGEAPSINANDKVIRVGSNFYPFREISANDKEDGNLTGFIKLKYNELNTEKVGDYKLIYSVTDKDNNTTEKTINVKVKDFGEKPVITAFDITLEKGQAFNQMENISATDKEDGDISKNIKVVSNNVNVNVPGNYLVEYSVQDNDGNISKCTRNVIVKEIDGLPIINAQNLKVSKGSDLDLFKNISAKDQNGNDITSSIKIEKMNLNINEKGVYNVIYSANDKDGNIGTKSVTIKVVEAPKIIAEDLIIPVNNKVLEKKPEPKKEKPVSKFLRLLAMNNVSYAEE